MNIRLIHELEIAIHEKLHPIHPYLTTNVTVKRDEREYAYAELSIIAKFRSDDQIIALIKMIDKAGSQASPRPPVKA